MEGFGSLVFGVLCYVVGLFVGGAVAIKENKVDVQVIEKATSICAINGGLKEIQHDTIVCVNGATFERGDK